MAQRPTTTPAHKGQTKSELALDFGVSVKTFMRWLKSFNEKLAKEETELIDVSRKIFTARDTKRIIAQFS